MLLLLLNLLLPYAFAYNNGASGEWARNLDLQLSRILSRLDQLETRVSRVQNLVQLRFDGVESAFTSTKLRLDVFHDDFSRIEEQLSRKWKILEAKFDQVVANVEGKLTSVQRDNRRHYEWISGGIDRVTYTVKNATETMTNGSSKCMQHNSSSLLPSKVVNMFEDLTLKVEHNEILLGILVNKSKSGGSGRGRSGSSSETISTVIMEALSSVDTLSSTLNRKLNELSRGMDERFEMVSMSINNFLDSAPLEQIEELLIRILDKVENGTNFATTLWTSLSEGIERERENVTLLLKSCIEGKNFEDYNLKQEMDNFNEDVEEELTEEDKKTLWERLSRAGREQEEST